MEVYESNLHLFEETIQILLLNADILTKVHCLKRSMIHQEMTEEIQALMNEKHYRFIQALKIVLRRNSSFFDELIDSEEEDDEESDSHTEEESSETDGESDPHAQDESSAEGYKTLYKQAAPA